MCVPRGSSAPAPGKESNPFAGLVGSGDHSPFVASARQVYATASSRASSLALQNTPPADDSAGRGRLAWATAVLALLAGGGYAYWHFLLTKP